MAEGDKKLVRSKSGLRIVAINEAIISPFTLTEPPWVPDNECPECIACKAKFGFTKRRHHCRRCGQCFCDSCTSSKLPLPRMCFVDPVRLCQKCSELTRGETDFFDRHIKTLTNGASFHVSKTSDQIENAPICVCKLQTDHRCICFEMGEEDIDPVMLSKVDKVQILTSGTDPLGNIVASGLSMSYKTENGDIDTMRLVASEIGNKKQAMLWIAAMQKAMKMLYEGQIAKS